MPGNPSKRAVQCRFLGILGHFGRVSLAPGAMIPQCLDPEQVQHPREVVAQHHQAEFAPALFPAAHEEMVHARPVLEGAERVFGELAALFHAPARLGHAQAVPPDGGLVLPALQFFVGGVFRQALRPQRAGGAGGNLGLVSLDELALARPGLALPAF